MENELINEVKNELEKKKIIQNNLRNQLNELEKLKNDENVKKYIELSKLDTNSNKMFINKTEDDLLNDEYNYYGTKVQETNNIYFCIGTFSYSTENKTEMPCNILVEDDDSNAVYKLYKNIENEQDYFEVLMDAVPMFEKTHRVIKASMYFSNIEYRKIKKEFFKTTILEGQDVALKRVLKNKKTQI